MAKSTRGLVEAGEPFSDALRPVNNDEDLPPSFYAPSNFTILPPKPLPTVGVAVFPLLVELTLIVGLVIYVIRKYISFRRTPYWVTFLALIGYILAFGLVFLMPLEAAMSTFYYCNPNCELPFNYVDRDVLSVIWSTIYWIMYVATWAIYPLGQSWVATGEFGFWRKLKASLRDNLIFYIIAGVAGAVVFIIMLFVVKWELSNILNVAVALATCWGVFLLVAFMGVGLVEIPRSCWRKGNLMVQLRLHYFKMACQHEELKKAHEELKRVEKAIKKLDGLIAPLDENRKYMDELVGKCPPDYQLLEEGDGKVTGTYSEIVDLHAELLIALHGWNTANTLYETTLQRALKLDDVVAATEDFKVKDHIKWTYKAPRRLKFEALTKIANYIEWLWWVKIYEYFWRVVSIFLAIISLLLLFCEITMFVAFVEADKRHLAPTISPLTLLVRSVDLSPIAIEIITLCVVSYMALCTFSAFFSFRFMSWYRLLPDQQTDSYSILFCAAYLSRLAPAIVLNLLYLINYDHPLYHSVYIEVVGGMRRVPLLGDEFNILFPILMFIISALTIFSVWSKLAECLPFCRQRSFSYDEWDDDQSVEDGKGLLQKERSARRRQLLSDDPSLANDLEQQGEVDDIDRRRFRSKYASQIASTRAKQSAAGRGAITLNAPNTDISVDAVLAAPPKRATTIDPAPVPASTSSNPVTGMIGSWFGSGSSAASSTTTATPSRPSFSSSTTTNATPSRYVSSSSNKKSTLFDSDDDEDFAPRRLDDDWKL